MSCVPLVSTAEVRSEGAQAVVLVTGGSTVVFPEAAAQAVVVAVGSEQVVVERCEQGPPGPAGDGSGALQIDKRLSEYAGDPAAQQAAQNNIGLGAVDPLAYYILAKS